MLDKETKRILNIINAICKDSSFKVVTMEDFKKIRNLTLETLTDTISFLQKEEYIKVKFHEEDSFCLCTLPKSKLIKELKQEELEKKKDKRDFIFLTALTSGIFAFVGCMIALVLFYILKG